ncbi:MAG: hypothetical protein II266_01695, partial [Clostridia bacterium]|nr:hypothetical protein [Clostridia bacterium]
MPGTTIESLEIEIKSSAEGAEQGLQRLYNTLDKLKNATKGGLGLTSTAKQVGRLNDALNRIDSGSVANLRNMLNALDKLGAVQNVKLSSTIARAVAEIGEASKKLNPQSVATLGQLGTSIAALAAVKDVKISSTIANGVTAISEAATRISAGSIDKIPALVNALKLLKGLSGIRISSTIAKQIVELGTAAELLQGIDLSIFGNLAEKLHPLAQLEKSNLGSAVNALKKLPEVATALNAMDIDAFAQKITQLSTALGPLATNMNAISAGFASFPSRIQRVISSTNALASANRGASGSYTDLYSRFRMSFGSIRMIADKIASFIASSNQYVENLNLFNVSMGKYAVEAQQYAERVGEIMGIDPSEWMRNQGIFMTLATGFGVVGDRAYTMSQNLTQLGYDLSSFFNISTGEAFKKLQSGISGELEPLRQLGFDLSQARLQAVALSLGIDQAYNSMTQAEKSQLRYYAIMTQVTTAQGDMARTLDAPANQLRILQAQVDQAARALGSVFVPILNAVLPVVIALAKGIRILAASIASLFGFTLPEVDYSGIGDVSAGAGDLADNLENAGGAAKKLKSYMMGFDELNVINPDSGGGGGGGGGSSGGGSDWEWDLPVYDFLGDAITSRVDEWVNKFQPWIDFIVNNLNTILPIVEAIGAGLLMWKIAKNFIPGLDIIKADLNNLLSLAVAVGTIAVTATLTYHFDNQFFQTGNWANLIAEGMTTALGAAIAGKVTQNALGNKWGGYAAGATLAISAATTIKALYDHVEQEGFDGKAIAAGIWAALKGAAAGGAIAVAVGASWVAGAAVGGVITLSVAAVVSFVAWKLNQNETAKRKLFGDIQLTAQEVKQYANSLFDFDVKARIDVLNTSINNTASIRAELNNAITRLSATAKQIEVGVRIPNRVVTDLNEQFYGESGILKRMQALMDASHEQLTLTFGLVPPKDVNGNDLSIGAMIQNMVTADETIMMGMEDLGKQMSDLLTKGMTEGLSMNEHELLTSIQQAMIDVQLALTTGSASGGFKTKIDFEIGNMTKESFQDVLTEYNSLIGELEQSYRSAYENQLNEWNGTLRALQILREEYVRQGNTE